MLFADKEDGNPVKSRIYKKGFFKGILYGIPFFVIGVASIFVNNVGLDWGQLSFLGISHLVLFTINMILVGANEEIWMRSLVLNSFIVSA